MLLLSKIFELVLILIDNVLLGLWNVVLCVFIKNAYGETRILLGRFDELVLFTFFIDCWLIFCIYLSVHEGIPVDTIEKWMSFYFSYVLPAAKSGRWITV